jgi:hypothetical protein
LEAKVWQDFQEYKKVTNMRYVTSVGCMGVEQLEEFALTIATLPDFVACLPEPAQAEASATA